MLVIKIDPKLTKEKEKRLAEMLQEVIDSSIYDHSGFNFYYDNKITVTENENGEEVERIPGINVEYLDDDLFHII